MTDSAHLRAGDADRDHTIALLSEAFAQGRLTQDEFDARLGTATTARTYGELAALTTDLPGSAVAVPPPVPPVVPQAAEAPAQRRSRQGKPGRQAWASWAGVSALVTVIWLASSFRSDGFHPGYFWPFWVIGPWGISLAVKELSNRR